MAPLDVVVVVPSLERGGAERVAVNHLNGLHRAGARARLVLTDGRTVGPVAAEVDPGVTVTSLGRDRVRAAVPPLLRLLRDDPPDVLLSTHTHVNLALSAARPLLPRRTRLVLREPTHAPRALGGRSTRGRRLLQRILYRRADLILVTSTPMLEDLRGLAGDRVVLMANPVRVDAIRASVATETPAGERRGRRFVSVGRLDAQKSLPDLIGAFARVATPDDELVLVGDGPLHDELVALTRAAGVDPQVRFTGDLATPWTEVAAADAFVLASRAEGMPNAALEALAVGTPVIASDELTVLAEVRDEAPPGAVRLVPRAELAASIGAVTRTPTDVLPRASLLPERFTASTANATLLAHLERLVGRHDGP